MGNARTALLFAASRAFLGAILAGGFAARAQVPLNVRILPVDLQSEPARYLLRLECGGYPLKSVSVGLILPPSTAASQVDFGGCARQGSTWTCASAPGLGPTVSRPATTARIGAGGAAGRTDTLYANLVGTPLLCSSGQIVDLAQIAAANLPGTLAPMLIATSQRVDDVFGIPHAVTSANAGVPIEQIRYGTGSSGGGAQFFVRPVPLTDTGSLDHRFEVVLDSPQAYEQLTLGLILPQGLTAAQARFGGCTVPTGGNLAERTCFSGSPDLGPNVDAGTSRTVGPASGLLPQGARADSLYMVLRGKQPGIGTIPVLNLPNVPTRLGVLEFDLGLVVDREDLLPPITFFGIGGTSLPLCEIGDLGMECSGDGRVEASRGADTDGDGVADSSGDKCPHYREVDRAADTDVDGRGNECECGDQTGDGRVSVLDIIGINQAIFNPLLVTPLCDTTNSGGCNVSDILGANVEIFSHNTSICQRQPVPGPP